MLKHCYRVVVLLGILVLLGLVQVLAQGTGSISGKITDRVSNEPLVGANILVLKTSLGASTGLDGAYIVRGIPAGDYVVRISYVGFAELRKSITVRAGEALTGLDFQLAGDTLMGEEVIVTAQARGQLAAISQQRASNTITNVVAAEKIHELPDENAATALSRLPGLSLMNGDQVVIRGIQAKMNTVLINGVQLPSTDMSDRSTRLGFISSNMLSGIEVTKVLTPDMDANAIGGVVNLRLREAPADLHYDALLQGTYNAQGHTMPVSQNYQGWASVSDRFFENSLGVFVQGNFSRFNGGGDIASGGFAGLDDPGYGFQPQYLSNVTFSQQVNITKNFGGSIILDYVLPNGKLAFQTSYSEGDFDNGGHRDNIALGTSLIRQYITARDIYKNYLTMNMLQAENTFFGDLKVDASIAHSLSRRSSDLQYGQPFEVPGMDFTSSTRALDAFYGDPNNHETLEQALNFPLFADDWTKAKLEQFAGVTWNTFTERRLTGALNFTLPVNLMTDVTAEFKLGGKISHVNRENDVERRYRRVVEPGANDGAADYLRSIGADPSLPINFPTFKDYDYVKNRGQYFLGGSHTFDEALNLSRMDTYMRLASGRWLRHGTSSVANDFYGYEQTTAAYLMGTVNLGQQVTILGGARLEHYHYDFNGTFFSISHPVDGDGTLKDTMNAAIKNRDDWFPNVQVRYKMTDWADIRLAYSKAAVRPDFTALLPSAQWDAGSNTGTAGNPGLKPQVSKNIDAQVSFYSSELGLFTIGGFYKRIDNYFYSQQQYIWALPPGVNFPDSAGLVAMHLPASTSTTKITTSLNNPNPAFLRGLELEWQTRFWYLPEPFSLMVLNVNYTRTWSRMDYQQYRLNKRTIRVNNRPVDIPYIVDTIYTARLLNQGDHTVNVALGMDYAGLSARISFRMQDNVITSVGNRPEQANFTRPVYSWDFTLKQQLPVEGLSVTLSGINIGHNKQTSYQQFAQTLGGPIVDNTSNISYYPSIYELSLRYSL